MNKNKKESRIVTSAPTHNGRPKRILIAVADPNTS